MTRNWSWWGFGFVGMVLLTVALSHFGVNAGGALGATLQHLERLFGTSILP